MLLFITTTFLLSSCGKEEINPSIQEEITGGGAAPLALNSIIAQGQINNLNEQDAFRLLSQLDEVDQDGRFTFSNSCSNYIEIEFDFWDDVTIDYDESTNTYDIGLELEYNYDGGSPFDPCIDPICDFFESTVYVVGQGKRNFPSFANKCILGSFEFGLATWSQSITVEIDLNPILQEFDCDPIYCAKAEEPQSQES